MPKLKLPFELEKPSNNEYVTQASEIGYGNSSAADALTKTIKKSSNTDKSWGINENYIAKMVYSDLPYTNYGISAVTGEKTSYDGYKCSDFIEVVEGSSIILNTLSANSFGLAFYSEANEASFISGSKNITGERTVTAPLNARYFRWCCTSNTDYYCKYNIYQKLVDDIQKHHQATLKNGYYSGTTIGSTIGVFTANDSWRATEIECSEGDIVVITGTGGSGGSRLYAFVDEDNVIVKVAKSSEIADNLAIAVPQSAVKVYMSSSDTSNTSLVVVTDAIKDINKRIDNEVANINESLSDINGDILGINTEIANIKNSVFADEEVTMRASQLGHKDNGINYSTGAESAYTDYYHSDYIEVKGGSTLEIYTVSANSFGLAFYSAQNESSYISGDKNTSSVRTVQVPANAKYFRWCNSGKSNDYYVTYIYQVPISGALDNMQDEIDDVWDGLRDVEGMLNDSVEVNMLSTQLSIANEGINANTGAAASYTDYYRSDFLKVKPGSTLEIYTVSANNFGLAFYSAANEASFISGNKNTSSVRTITVPNNAKYFRWCNSGRNSSYYVNYVEEIPINEKFDKINIEIDELNSKVDAGVAYNFTSGIDAKEIGINILFVGNSYARDAAVYLPQMLKSIGVTNFKVGIAMRSGCSIQMHYNSLGQEVYYYDHYSGTDSDWNIDQVNLKTLEYCVQKEDWDVILFQQVSFQAGYKYVGNITPYLGGLLDAINGYLLSSSNFSGSVKFGWIATPAYPTGSTDLSSYGYSTSVEMAQDILKLSKFIYDNYAVIDFIVPTCIGIENARKTTLNEYGDYDHNHQSGTTGGLMYNDSSLHLLEGIGRQIAGYVVLTSICCISCLGNKERFTTNSSLQPHGTATGSTDANSYLAQKCVIEAFKKPTL